MRTVIIQEKPRRGKALLLLIALFSIFLAGQGALSSTLASFTSQTSLTGAEVSSGKLAVAFVDAEGKVTTTSTTTIANAVPLMAKKVFPLKVINLGTTGADITLSNENLIRHNTADFNEVLQLNVLDASGTSIYNGKVSEFTFHDSKILASNEYRDYTLEVTWPSSTADNAYMNSILTFDTTIKAVSIAGSAQTASFSTPSTKFLTASDWGVTSGSPQFGNGTIDLTQDGFNLAIADSKISSGNIDITTNATLTRGHGYGIFIRAHDAGTSNFGGITFQLDPGLSYSAVLKVWDKNGECGSPMSYKILGDSFGFNKEHAVRVVAKGDVLDVYIDGEKTLHIPSIETSVNQTWCGFKSPTGTGVGVRTWGSSEAHFKNFGVSEA